MSSPSIITVQKTGSTNDDMMGLARTGAPEGSWLRAESQTGGKGRSGRQWISPPGNLYASTLVRLQPADPLAPSLALVAAVAVHETVSAYASAVPLMLKWPNDLLSDGRKLAGILLEREQDAVVVGIGINLAHHPDVIDRPATSLGALGVGSPDPQLFLADLADAFQRWLQRWRGEGLLPVRARWLETAHPAGTALSIRSGEDMVDGLFDGLDEMGALRLRLADGRVRVIPAGDVFLL
jgi:BirA family transcriptional regulator, biotin operon repressor / biotin---[acetyl-CoA-carboxylase] ligase